MQQSLVTRLCLLGFVNARSSLGCVTRVLNTFLQAIQGAFVVSDLGDLCLLWVSSPFLQAGFCDGLRIKLNLGNFHDTSQHVHVACSAVLESKCKVSHCWGAM